MSSEVELHRLLRTVRRAKDAFGGGEENSSRQSIHLMIFSWLLVSWSASMQWLSTMYILLVSEKSVVVVPLQIMIRLVEHEHGFAQVMSYTVFGVENSSIRH